jgi:hypothetical protein
MDMENDLVFIVGCARTGSTLLRDVLNRSERICITPETHFLRRISRVGLWKEILRFGDLANDRNAERFVDYLYSAKKKQEKNFWGWFNKQVDSQEFMERFLASDRSEQAIFTLMMRIYAEKKRGIVTPKMILGEKTPTHVYYIPTLFKWYPHLKIIHTFRDPRGIFVSSLKRVKAGKWGLKARFPRLPDGLVHPLDNPFAVLHTTKTWLDAVRLHTRYQQLYPRQYHLVRFEDMIADPQSQVQQVCKFLGVPFEPRMLDEVIVIGSSYRDQRRGPTGFDTHAINRWQEHIAPLTRAWFSFMGRKHLKRFGYLP